MPSHDPTYPLFPILSFLGFVLSFIPLPWHLQAWNSGTCAYMVWTGLGCLVLFVNSLVWSGNVNNPAPIWCDISSKFILGAGVGITASTLCISRRLYSIASSTAASITRQDKRRAVMIDLGIAVGIPVLVMVLHVVVQGHRFDILEDFGCYAVIYNTIPAYFLVFMWPIVLGAISFVFSSLTLLSFYRRRIQFAQLASANSALSASRYLRLMLLAMCDMMLTVPIGILSLYVSQKDVYLAPWVSWEETHYDFARVAKFPAVIWRSRPSFERGIELTRWLFPASAIVFFALFGLASEARKNYAKALWFVAKPFGLKPGPRSPKSKGSPLPTWRQDLPIQKPPPPPPSPPAYDIFASTASDATFTISLQPMSPSNDTESTSDKTLAALSPTEHGKATMKPGFPWAPSSDSDVPSKRFSSPY